MLAYRSDFIFWTVVSLIWSVFNIFFFTLIVDVQGHIGGWNKQELYVLLSVFTILDAFTWSYFYSTMKIYTWSIFSGFLDVLLTKPLDPQLHISISQNNYNNAPRFIIGICMLVWSVSALPNPPGTDKILLSLVLFVTSFFLLYSVWFIAATFAFWVEKLDNINDIVPGLRRVFQVPRTVYTGIFSTLFTVVLPVGLLTSLPSEALIGRTSLGWNLFFIAISIGFFLLARWFFGYSLRKYSSIGS